VRTDQEDDGRTSGSSPVVQYDQVPSRHRGWPVSEDRSSREWVERNTIEVEFPCETKNPMNNRQHWTKVARTSSQARMAAWAALKETGRSVPPLPIVVLMMRIGAGTSDKSCGLNGALKPIRDGVADWLGLPDNHPLIYWQYRQEKCRRGVKRVRIKVIPSRDIG
jgi:hypothetical protein